jgi:hypothetical protein
MGEGQGPKRSLEAATLKLQQLLDALTALSSVLSDGPEADLLRAWRATEELRAARHESEALLRDVQEQADLKVDAIDRRQASPPASGIFAARSLRGGDEPHEAPERRSGR